MPGCENEDEKLSCQVWLHTTMTPDGSVHPSWRPAATLSDISWNCSRGLLVIITSVWVCVGCPENQANFIQLQYL